jgi:2-dehydro-3-deoxygluconokinase
MSPEVISLGEPMVEFCATEVGRLGDVSLFKRGWGGDTSNFAVAAARQGLEVAHICRLGGDEFGRSFLDLWESEGMDNSRVLVDPGGWTAIYIISLIEGGDHDFTYYRAGSAASRYNVDDLDLDYIGEASYFHTSGISLAISLEVREAAIKALQTVKENGGYNSFDINMRTKLWDVVTARSSLAEAFKVCDVVFASMEDINTLYGIKSPEKAADHLKGLGVDTVVVKHGDKGCFVSKDGQEFTMPGYKVEVVDTTGSGDAFDGAWIKGIEMNWDLEKTASFSNAVGALTATGLGAVAPIPSYDEAVNLIREHEGVW